ncbi:MAG TPA: polyprenyl synthetase family protein [Patescibacteria group bacterium]
MDFQAFLKSSAQKIQKILPSLFLKDLPSNSKLKKILKNLQSNTKGGKYIRGSLIRLGYMLIKNEENKNILTVASSYEILHTSLLIHDDIIDKSILRRGRKSLWKVVGQNLAICLGDVGFFLTNKIIAESKFQPYLKTEALSVLNKTILNTFYGEMLDVAISENRKTKRLEKEVLLIHKLKTASYSISGPLLIGAILAGADKKMLDNINLFGENLGIAFQIQDDILGTFGNESEVGKSVTSDIEENKNTLLIIYALLTGTKEQKNFLKTHYGTKEISSIDHKHIKRIFEDTGALAYSEKKAKFYAGNARKNIDKITDNKRYQKILNQLVDFTLNRQK